MDKIIVPYKISESFIIEHPRYTFLFSWDYLQKGALGQCVNFISSITSKPYTNCCPISTAYKWCANPVYFQDNSTFWEMAMKSFLNIPTYYPIIPCRKIGMGCARMQEFAPNILKSIQSKLKEITYPELYIDYGNNSIRPYNFSS